MIDGKFSFIGGVGNCEAQAVEFRALVNQRIAETQGMSPVSIASSMSIGGGNVSLSATFRLVDPVNLTNLRGTLLLYEDNVFWCCGYGNEDTWQHVTRAIYDENVTLSQVGDEVTIQTTVPVGAGWNPDELHASAYLQTTSSSKEMIQAQAVGQGSAPDFSVWIATPIRSVPEGNGTAVFDAVLTNISDQTDTFTISPGSFGDWTSDFLVCGDNTPHGEPYAIDLAPDQACEIQFRVHTNAAVEIRSGAFQVSSGASGRVQTMTVRVFNGSYAVLLVDDDFANTDEVALTNALTALDVLYEDWDIYNGHGNQSPTYSNMVGFDYVIWQTGLRFNNLLTDGDKATLMEFMDNGGSLFLTSQEFIDTQAPGDPFVTNYLGVASWVLDRSYTVMNGVPGDPIGNGLSLPLHFDYAPFNKGDHIVPGPNAGVAFVAPDGSNSTIHNVMPLRGNAKAVFMATPFNAISQTDPDPNNTRVVLRRILDWLQPEVPASAEDLPPLGARSAIVGAQPNPFNPRTEIAFEISGSDAGSPVRLEVFDAAGRRVAGLFDATLAPGPHVWPWDVSAAPGGAVESGVYFARLTTRTGESSAKLILLK